MTESQMILALRGISLALVVLIGWLVIHGSPP